MIKRLREKDLGRRGLIGGLCFVFGMPLLGVGCGLLMQPTSLYEADPPPAVEEMNLVTCLQDYKSKNKCCLYVDPNSEHCTMLCVSSTAEKYGRQDFDCETKEPL